MEESKSEELEDSVSDFQTSTENLLDDTIDENYPQQEEYPPEKVIHSLVTEYDLLRAIPKELKKKYLDGFKLFSLKGNKIPASSVILLMRGLNKNPLKKQVEKWLEDLNVDKDKGVINKNEFLLLMKQPDLKPIDSELILREAFRTFDENETGELDANELKRILTEYGEPILNEKEIEEFIEKSVDSTTNTIFYYDYIKVMLNSVKKSKEKKNTKKKKKKKK